MISTRGLILTVLWVITIACGWYGFYILSPLAPASSNLYSAVQLFGLNGNFSNKALPLYIEVARFVAPALTIYTVILAFAGNLLQTTRRLKARYFWRNHVVVCGLGKKGLAISISLLASGKRVIVLDPSPSEEHTRQIIYNSNVVIIRTCAIGHMSLASMNVNSASDVFVVCGNDAVNAEIWSVITKNKRINNFTVHIHMQDLLLARYLERSVDNLQRKEGSSRLRFINPHQVAVRQLFQNYPLDLINQVYGEERNHIALVGFGKMGQHILLEALRLYSSERSNKKLFISVVDRNATVAWKKLKVNNPGIENLCQVNLLQAEITSDEQQVLSKIKSQNEPVTAWYICLGDDSKTLRKALYLRQSCMQMKNFNAPVFIHLRASPGFESLIYNNKNSIKLTSGIVPFGALKDGLTCKALLNESFDHLAQSYHEFYLEKFGMPKRRGLAHQPWGNLSETYRRSSRHAADHLNVKLRRFDLRLISSVSTKHNDIRFSSSTITDLAQLEHERWCVERLLEGWRYAPIRSDVAKLNPKLLPWDELQQEAKNMDEEQINDIPQIAARANLSVNHELIVGVTGHRSYKSPEKVTKEIRCQLQELVESHPNCQLICISALAEGADQEVARLAMDEFNAELWVVSPFPVDLYMSDFSAEGEELFKMLLNRSTHFFEMPLRFGSASDVVGDPDIRNQQYALVGAYVVQRAHHMIAVWDGLDAKGLGGTAQVVSWAEAGQVPHAYIFSRLLRKPLANVRIVTVER